MAMKEGGRTKAPDKKGKYTQKQSRTEGRVFIAAVDRSPRLLIMPPGVICGIWGGGKNKKIGYFSKEVFKVNVRIG